MFELLFAAWLRPVTTLTFENAEQRAIFTAIEREYAPFVRSRGQVLHLEVQEQGLGLTAMADSDGHDLVVRVGREMLRSPRLTNDGLRVTLCHELGHIFGGAPRRPVPPEWDGPTAPDGDSLLSAEGEADTYATLACFRRIVRGEDHRAALAGQTISPRVASVCDEAWGAESDGAFVCRRAALGGWNMLNFVKDFPISFETPDASVTERTLNGWYPDRQCRLDTLLASAVCTDEKPLAWDPVDASTGTCSERAHARPACWFRAR